MSRSSLLLVTVLCAACANEPVTVEVNFPSERTFLHTSFARVAVFDLGPGSLGECPSLLADAIAGSATPALDSGNVQVCTLFDGGVQFDEVGEGPKAFVAIASNASNSAILAGCTVAEIYADAPRVVVHLGLTEEYASAIAGDPVCSSIADKCVRGGCGP